MSQGPKALKGEAEHRFEMDVMHQLGRFIIGEVQSHTKAKGVLLNAPPGQNDTVSGSP